MSDELIGTKLGDRYRLDAKIGQGGSGTIFKAHDDQLGRDVAIKLLKIDGEKGERLRMRFKTEALAAGRIQHANVIAIYDVNAVEGAAACYMVMELLHGWDLLNELHHKGPLEPARALKLFLPCLRGLARCHEHGVVHKDLKPSNLFIRHPGTPEESMCLLDFGVARLMEGERITRIGGVAGTPRYLAPEYIRDASVGPTVDVYQMGLIFIEALTGRPCIPKGEGEFQTFQRHLKGDLDLPPGLNSGRFAAVIQRALCVDAEVRYPNAGSFADSLEDVPAEMIEAALIGRTTGVTIAPEMTTVINDAAESGPHEKLTPDEVAKSQDDLPVSTEVTAWFSAIRSPSGASGGFEPVTGPVSTIEDRSLHERMQAMDKKSDEPENLGSIDEDALGAFVMGAAVAAPTLDESSEFSPPELRRSGAFEAPSLEAISEASSRAKSQPRAQRPSSKRQKKKRSFLPAIALFGVFFVLVVAAVGIYGYWFYYYA